MLSCILVSFADLFRYPLEKGQAVDLNKSTNNKDVEELEAVAGTAEDDTSDRIAKFCDDEMLYGDTSLFAVFGPMIVHICGTPKKYKVHYRRFYPVQAPFLTIWVENRVLSFVAPPP